MVKVDYQLMVPWNPPASHRKEEIASHRQVTEGGVKKQEIAVCQQAIKGARVGRKRRMEHLTVVACLEDSGTTDR